MIDAKQLAAFVQSALQEDVGDGDHSTLCCIDKEAKGKAVLKVKEEGIIAGLEVMKHIFQHLEPCIDIRLFKIDGDAVKSGDVAFEVEGKVHTILSCERLVLNTLQRMSGIATLTNSYVQALKGYKTKLLDTRKTTPNFRLLEKEAVKIGGGINHRFGLYDMIMLKDNHIDYCGDISTAILKADAYRKMVKPSLHIEVETRSLADVEKVLSVGLVNRIMLDNFTPDEVSKAVLMVNGKCETEASGGIHLTNLTEYAQTGVDYISCGAIIHHAVSLDMSLKAIIKHG